MIAWLVQTLAASTLLMVVVMAVRPLVRAKTGAALAYWLWAVPLIRMVLPPLPALPLPQGATAFRVPDAALSAIAMAPQPPTLAAGTAGTLLIVLWALGAVLHLAWRSTEYSRFVHRARAAAVGAPLRVGKVRVWTSAFVDGPVASGLWRRDIFLPLDFETRFDAAQRRLALAHELTHHRRGDIFWNLVALVVLSIHWFNPLAHLAHRLFRLDQELACDADVMAAEGGNSRFEYGLALARAALPAGASPLCALSRVAVLKQRLGALAAPDRRPGPASCSMLMIAAVGAILATASFSAGLPVISNRNAQSLTSTPSWRPDLETASPPLPHAKPVETTGRRPASWIREAAERALEDPLETRSSPSDRRSADYLAERRRLGLLRHPPSAARPADLASARGRPLLAPPPADF